MAAGRGDLVQYVLTGNYDNVTGNVAADNPSALHAAEGSVNHKNVRKKIRWKEMSSSEGGQETPDDLDDKTLSAANHSASYINPLAAATGEEEGRKNTRWL